MKVVNEHCQSTVSMDLFPVFQFTTHGIFLHGEGLSTYSLKWNSSQFYHNMSLKTQCQQLPYILSCIERMHYWGHTQFVYSVSQCSFQSVVYSGINVFPPRTATWQCPKIASKLILLREKSAPWAKKEISTLSHSRAQNSKLTTPQEQVLG